MSERHPTNASVTFAKIVSGDAGGGGISSTNESQQSQLTESELHSADSAMEQRKLNSFEDWPSLDVFAHHEENDLGATKSLKLQKTGTKDKTEARATHMEETVDKVCSILVKTAGFVIQDLLKKHTNHFSRGIHFL